MKININMLEGFMKTISYKDTPITNAAFTRLYHTELAYN